MVTAGQIFDYLNKKFPLELCLDFDNAGFLVGDKSSPVKRAVVALDCDKNTVSFAKETKAQLIITHHPVIFDPLKSVLSGSTVFSLVQNNISVISMHTNLDIAKGGVNDCLCKALGVKSVKEYTASDGFILRSGELSETADSLAEKIKNKLGFNVRYTGNGKIEKVLICSGSGGDYLEEAINGGFDALITADCKHHQFINAINSEIALFDCGHYASENVVINPLARLLKEQFETVEFIEFNNKSIKSV